MGSCNSVEDSRPLESRDYLKDVISFNRSHNVPSAAPHSKHRDPVGDLFGWAQACEQRSHGLQMELGLARSEIDRLSRELSASRAAATEAANRHEASQRQSREHLRTTEAAHRSIVDQLKSDHAQILRQQQMEHSGNLEIQEASHRSEIDELQLKNASDIEKLEMKLSKFEKRKALEMKNMRKEHNKHTDKLVGQLLVNQDADRAWTDEKFIQELQKVRQQLGFITSASQYSEIRVAADQQVGTSVDPTGFITRNGMNKLRFLLKGRIWSILLEEFFGQPYGFGSFPTAGQATNDFTDLFLAWLRIYSPQRADNARLADNFTIFADDKLANRWRAATFSCVDAAIKAQHWSPGSDERVSNVGQANRRIESLLSEVAALSNQRLSSGIQADIRKTTRLVREIAIQFGVHPAHISFYTAQIGERVVMGERFRDCQNRDMDRGLEQVVDVITMPGLERIGDGVKDLATRRIIVPCEVYPDLVTSER